MNKLSHGSLQDQVNSFLFKYRTTPQSTTGVSLAELLMNYHKLRTHLDLLVPDTGERVRKRQTLQRHSHNSLHFQVQLQPDAEEQLLPDTYSKQANQELVSLRYSTRNRQPPAQLSPDNY